MLIKENIQKDGKLNVLYIELLRMVKSKGRLVLSVMRNGLRVIILITRNP